jgi:hypothetical protein
MTNARATALIESGTMTLPAAAFLEHGAELFAHESIRRVNLLRIEELQSRDLERLGQSETLRAH